MNKLISNPLILLGFIISLFATSGCEMNVKQKGYMFNQAQLEVLVPFKSSKQDVLNTLGSPSSVSEFGDKKWLYISSKKENFAFLSQKTLEQKIVAIEFDHNDIIKKIDNYGLAQANKIDFSSDSTPTGGDDDRLVKKLFGNIGRFNKVEKNRKVAGSRN